MMRRILTVFFLLVALAAGFVAGSWWHAELSMEPPAGPTVAPIAIATAPAAAVTVEVAAPRAPAPPPPDVECVTKLATVVKDLAAARLEHAQREERRVLKEGAAIPFSSRPTEPRFEPEALRTAIGEALVQAHVPGRINGLDCTEWPCIIYGRIRGTEDEMEKLEGAKALAAYEKDILTVLLWVVTDEAANAAPLPILPGRPEQTLFAFAFYPRGLERPLAENTDRRLRTRTAELWNTMSPTDETGR